jgi:hypothetical protein
VPSAFAGSAGYGASAAIRRGVLASVLVAAAALLCACSRDAGTPAQAPRPLLLLAVEKDGGSEWLLLDPADGSRHVLGRSAADSELLVVDDEAGDFIYRSGHTLMRHSWRARASAAISLGAPPPIGGRMHALWIDRESRALVAIEMREPSADELAQLKPEPPDARPVWVVLWRWQDGRWQQRERRASSWGAAGAAGAGVLDELRVEHGRSRRTIDDAASCAASLCDDEPDATLTAGLAGPDDEPDEWRRLPLAGGHLLFGVGFGETWHPVGPLLFIQGGQPARPMPVDAGDALRLQPRGTWLVVSPELPPGAAWLFELPSGPRVPLGTVVTTPAWVH